MSRIRFLTAEEVEPGRVRGPIFESWRRSRDLNVAADEITMRYVRDPDMDTPLIRAAEPVLRNLREQLDGQPVSIILTDPTGLVLSRQTADADLERHLDRVLLAPGFSYAEKFVGTNGIGTALEVGGPAMVFGHEHYAEDLEDLACAGIPIHDPISGRTVGAIDLTCWRKDAGALLVALAKSTAQQIRRALLTEVSAKQLELFQEYLRICRRKSGAVFALNGDVVMSNEYARLLDPADQAVLLGQAAVELAAGHHGSVLVDLPTGSSAQLFCRPVRSGGQPAGLVVHVKVDDSGGHGSADRHEAARMPLPGLVGSAPPWLRAVDEVERIFQSTEWLAVQGEPGVGKLALLQAVHQRRSPDDRFLVVDVSNNTNPQWLTSLRRALSAGGGTIVIRHVDQLDDSRILGLTAALLEARVVTRNRPPRVAVTLGNDQDTPRLASLIRLFPSSVEVPPLRLHLEDVPLLVHYFLARIGNRGLLVCSPEVMRLLMRSSWPGNAEQLHQMLRQVVKRRRTGSIQPSDLPPEMWAVSRRRLSPLEAMERDAIVQGLMATHGNKAEAARSLGMSRATMYRKIRQYGVVVPTP